MEKNTLHTNAAPAAIGPYAQAVKAGNVIYTSGQLGIDPAAGTLAQGIGAQTHAALRNLREVLKAGGADLDNVVKTTVFVRDLGDFAAVNEIYGSYFKEGEYPARSCVEVSRLPKDALVEIECVAVL